MDPDLGEAGPEPEPEEAATGHGLSQLRSPDGTYAIEITVDEATPNTAKLSSTRCFSDSICIELSDDASWAYLASPDVAQRLELIVTDCLPLLLKQLSRLRKSGGCSFGLLVGGPWIDSAERRDPEQVCLLLNFVASMIRANRLTAFDCQHFLSTRMRWESVPPAVIKALDNFTDAIKATSELKSLTMRLGDQNSAWGRGVRARLAKSFLAAFEANMSLIAIDLYSCADHYPIYARKEQMNEDDTYEEDYGLDLLKQMTARNRGMQEMNASVASGGDVAWSGGCPLELTKSLFVHKFDIRQSFFDPEGDACFCVACMAKRGDAASYLRGVPPSRYALPAGFVRLGLDVSKPFAEEHNVFHAWHVSYHGTSADSVVPIFKSGLKLMKAGDVMLGGETLTVRKGHFTTAFERINAFTGENEMFDPTQQVFTSPSPRYSAHPAYARRSIVKLPTDPSKQISMQFMFQVRQRPGSYKIGQETVGAGKKKLDPLFENKELEWYTQEQIGMVVTGLCIRLGDV